MDVSEHRDLMAACAWTATLGLVISSGDGGLIRAALGLPAVLLLPGHVLLRAVGLRTASVLEHVVYAVGTSLACAIAGGFVLNAAGLLTPAGWMLWTAAIVFGGSAAAARRPASPQSLLRSPPDRLRLRHAAAFALSALLVTVAYALAVHDESMQRQFKYTEFWMTPSPGNGSLAVGVHNEENEARRYDLEVTLDGSQFAALPSIELAPGHTWTREIVVPQRTLPQKAEAKLYRSDNMQLYRRVSALVPGSGN